MPSALRGLQSFGRVVLQPLDERGRAARAARDQQNRVVAGNRADHLREPRAIERLGQRLRLAAAGADDDELLDAVDVAQEFRGRALERGERRLGVRGASAPGR